MKLVSDLVFRIALLAAVLPVLPINDQVAGMLDHVTRQLEQVQASVGR